MPYTLTGPWYALTVEEHTIKVGEPTKLQAVHMQDTSVKTVELGSEAPRTLAPNQERSLSTSKVEWATFTFPPINLWNMQLHGEIVKLLNQYYYEHYKYLLETSDGTNHD